MIKVYSLSLFVPCSAIPLPFCSLFKWPFVVYGFPFKDGFVLSASFIKTGAFSVPLAKLPSLLEDKLCGGVVISWGDVVSDVAFEKVDVIEVTLEGAV